MKRRLTVLMPMMLTMCLNVAAIAASRDRGPDGTQRPRLTRSERRIGRAVRAINRARGPRTAIRAYARGRKTDFDDPRLHRAHLRRMLDFGVPELAGAAAGRLIELDPDDGLARGVAGYIYARQGRPGEALGQLLAAADQLPEEPFILRTAANLIAWFDATAEGTEAISDLRADVEELRRRFSGKPDYDVVYGRARRLHSRKQKSRAPQGHSFPPPTRTFIMLGPHSSVGVDGGIGTGVISHDSVGVFSPVIIVPPQSGAGGPGFGLDESPRDTLQRERLIARLTGEFERTVGVSPDGARVIFRDDGVVPGQPMGVAPPLTGGRPLTPKGIRTPRGGTPPLVGGTPPLVGGRTPLVGGKTPLVGGTPARPRASRSPTGVAPARPRARRTPRGVAPPRTGGRPMTPRGIRTPRGGRPPLVGGAPARPRASSPPMGVAPPLVGGRPPGK